MRKDADEEEYQKNREKKRLSPRPVAEGKE